MDLPARKEPPDASTPEAATAAPGRFVRYLRDVVRGAKLGRTLSEAEAREAMAMILARQVAPEQLGALLAVLRYRKETPEELAGFVRAAREAAMPLAGAEVDLDWPSYADRHKQLPYFILAALVLAQNGVKVLMHGLEGEGGATTRAVLGALGHAPVASAAEVSSRLSQRHFAYLPIERLSPPVAALFALRPVLGVRTAANTFCRALNPAAAPASLVGVFHPTYLDTHVATARCLGQGNVAAFKGGGGEAQRNPDKPCWVVGLRDGAPTAETWPALTESARHPWREEPLEPERVAALWRGEWDAPGPVAAVTATLAVALKLLGRAATIAEAEAIAQAMWAARTPG